MFRKNLSAEKIAEKKEKILKREEKLSKKIGRLNKVSVIFIFFVICSFAVAYGADALWLRSKDRGELIDANTITAVSDAMNYGLVCQGKDFIAYAGADKGLDFVKSGNETKLSDDRIYYINTDGKFLYYIKKSDDFIYKCDMKGNESCVVPVMADRLMLCSDKLYFINGSDNNRLYSVDKDGKTKPKKITERFVSKYAAISDEIYYLSDYSLYGFKEDSQQEYIITEYAEDFWYNGNLLILNNGRLIETDPLDKKEKIFAENCETVVGMDGENVYYVCGGELWAADADGENERKVLKGGNIYKAVYSADSKLYCYTLEKDKNGRYANKFSTAYLQQ